MGDLTCLFETVQFVPLQKHIRSGWLFVALDKALYSDCSVARRSRKAVDPTWNTFHTLLDVKERHGLFENSRGIAPGTVDRMSKYITASRTWEGKGDCSPINPRRRPRIYTKPEAHLFTKMNRTFGDADGWGSRQSWL